MFVGTPNSNSHDDKGLTQWRTQLATWTLLGTFSRFGSLKLTILRRPRDRGWDFASPEEVGSLRKRQLIASYQMGLRQGTYWGMRTNILNYKLPTAMPCPFSQTLVLASTATRLKKLDKILQERIINWGYAVCDAAIRRHVDPTASVLAGFPYPAAGVG